MHVHKFNFPQKKKVLSCLDFVFSFSLYIFEVSICKNAFEWILSLLVDVSDCLVKNLSMFEGLLRVWEWLIIDVKFQWVFGQKVPTNVPKEIFKYYVSQNIWFLNPHQLLWWNLRDISNGKLRLVTKSYYYFLIDFQKIICSS